MPVDKTPWTDDTIMPWGAHKEERMRNVPASYLDWLRDQPWIEQWPGLTHYIAANKSRIDKEMDDAAPERSDDGEDGFDSYEDYKRYG